MEEINFDKEPFYNYFLDLTDDVLPFDCGRDYVRENYPDFPNEKGLNFQAVAYDELFIKMLGVTEKEYFDILDNTDTCYNSYIYWWPKSHTIHIAIEDAMSGEEIEKVAVGELGNLEKVLKDYAEQYGDTIEELLELA